MPDYWIQLDITADLDLDQVTVRVGELVRLAAIDGDVEVNSVAVTLWTEDGDVDEETLVPAGGTEATP